MKVIDYIKRGNVIRMLKEAVKRDEERPQGEWIIKKKTPASVSYCCSVCKLEGVPITPFCPWCGAYMKGSAGSKEYYVYDMVYNQAIKDTTEHIQKMKSHYADGTMCSMSESIIGECVCDDILKYLKELKRSDE